MKRIIFPLVIAVVVFALAGCGLTDKKEVSSDASKFKEEYENLNGKENSTGKKHRAVDIATDNPFIYATAEDIVEKIENKETFYVYFGSAYCPWCRSVIEQAITVAKKNKIDDIYYVDIWDGDHKEILRDIYELENGKAKVVQKGTESYEKILKYFDNVLEDYILTDENGREVSTGEKRIMAPNFIYVRKGKAVALETGISDNQKDSREKLTDKILKDEKNAFNKLFSI